MLCEDVVMKHVVQNKTKKGREREFCFFYIDPSDEPVEITILVGKKKKKKKRKTLLTIAGTS